MGPMSPNRKHKGEQGQVDEKTLIEALASIPGWELTEDEIEGLAAKRGIIVCSTWPDSTKPHGFHYE